MNKLSRRESETQNLENWTMNNQETLEIPSYPKGWQRVQEVKEKTKKPKEVSLKELDRTRFKTQKRIKYKLTKEFDPGSGRTLAARLTHASRTSDESLLSKRVADGWVTREQPAFKRGITFGNER